MFRILGRQAWRGNTPHCSPAMQPVSCQELESPSPAPSRMTIAWACDASNTVAMSAIAHCNTHIALGQLLQELRPRPRSDPLGDHLQHFRSGHAPRHVGAEVSHKLGAAKDVAKSVGWESKPTARTRCSESLSSKTLPYGTIDGCSGPIRWGTYAPHRTPKSSSGP
jgi:hypothetical protein